MTLAGCHMADVFRLGALYPRGLVEARELVNSPPIIPPVRFAISTMLRFLVVSGESGAEGNSSISRC